MAARQAFCSQARGRRIVLYLLGQPAHQLLSAASPSSGCRLASRSPGSANGATTDMASISSVSRIPDAPGDHGSEVHAMSANVAVSYWSRRSCVARRQLHGRFGAGRALVSNALLHPVPQRQRQRRKLGARPRPHRGPRLHTGVARGHDVESRARHVGFHARRKSRAGDLDEQAAPDLMAFFYAARFFEKPGDAGRGKRAFRERCADAMATGAVNLNQTCEPMARPHRSHWRWSTPCGITAPRCWRNRIERRPLCRGSAPRI